MRDSSQGSSPVERAQLDQLLDLGGPVFARKLLGIFFRVAPERVAAAREALGTGDAAAIERVVHNLKSSAGNVGALALRELAAEVEHALARGLPVDLGAGLAAIEEELDRVLAALRSFERDLPPDP